MNTASESQHTKGELQIPFGYVAQKKDDNSWFLTIEILGQGKIAQVYGKTKEECEANAERIIQATNMHDELVGAIKETHREAREIIGNSVKFEYFYKSIETILNKIKNKKLLKTN